MKRFELNYDEDKINDVFDDNGTSYDLKECCKLLNDQQARIEMLEKGILDCLFNNKSIGILAEEMGLVE